MLDSAKALELFASCLLDTIIYDSCSDSDTNLCCCFQDNFNLINDHKEKKLTFVKSTGDLLLLCIFVKTTLFKVKFSTKKRGNFLPKIWSWERLYTWSVWKQTILCNTGQVFLFQYFFATSATSLAQIFTGLFLYACWDTASEDTGVWQLSNENCSCCKL